MNKKYILMTLIAYIACIPACEKEKKQNTYQQIDLRPITQTPMTRPIPIKQPTISNSQQLAYSNDLPVELSSTLSEKQWQNMSHEDRQGLLEIDDINSLDGHDTIQYILNKEKEEQNPDKPQWVLQYQEDINLYIYHLLTSDSPIVVMNPLLEEAFATKEAANTIVRACEKKLELLEQEYSDKTDELEDDELIGTAEILLEQIAIAKEELLLARQAYQKSTDEYWQQHRETETKNQAFQDILSNYVLAAQNQNWDLAKSLLDQALEESLTVAHLQQISTVLGQ